MRLRTLFVTFWIGFGHVGNPYALSRQLDEAVIDASNLTTHLFYLVATLYYTPTSSRLKSPLIRLPPKRMALVGTTTEARSGETGGDIEAVLEGFDSARAVTVAPLCRVEIFEGAIPPKAVRSCNFPPP